MESIYPELALSGSKILCTRTDTVFFPISEVSDGTVSFTMLENGKMEIAYILISKRHLTSVIFGIIMLKFKFLGAKEAVGRLIYSFIYQRKQTVVVNGASSRVTNAKSRVPQGTVLGPVQFSYTYHI